MIGVFISIKDDWKRYTSLHTRMNLFLFLAVFFRNPGMLFSVMYRFERYFLYESNVLFKIIGALLYPGYFMITYYIYSIDISPRVKIGKSLYVHNRGITFTENVIAGDYLTLDGPLTLGRKGVGTDNGAPTLENHVTVFTGARVIGRVLIGNNVYIGANAVVVKDVPSYCVVAGVPAKVIKRLKPGEGSYV